MTVSDLIREIVTKVSEEFPSDDGYTVIQQFGDCDTAYAVGVKRTWHGNTRRAAAIVLRGSEQPFRPLSEDDLWSESEVMEMRARFDRDFERLVAYLKSELSFDVMPSHEERQCH